MQRDQPFEIVGKLGAMRRLAFGKGVARPIMRVPQMIHAGQHGAEGASVVDHAADGDAAEAHAMIAALAPDEARALYPRRAPGDRRARS